MIKRKINDSLPVSDTIYRILNICNRHPLSAIKEGRKKGTDGKKETLCLTNISFFFFRLYIVHSTNIV